MITKITKTLIRYYSDNDQTVLYVHWIDDKAGEQRTECDAPTSNPHMLELLARAFHEGVKLEHETW